MKKMVLSISLGLAFMLIFTGVVQAATYSQKKTTTTSAGGAQFRVSETANYTTTGNTRWDFSSKNLSYAGGTMYPINSSLTAKTVNQYSSNNLYYTGRDYTVKATNQSYRDYTSSASLRWTFNTSSNSWN